MKKLPAKLSLFMALILILTCVISCAPSQDNESSTAAESEEEKEVSEVKIPDEEAKALWKEEYADANNGFTDANSVYGLAVWHNGKAAETLPKTIESSEDYRYAFYGADSARIANLAEGYALTVPSVDFETDYSLCALRSKYITDDFIITVTLEDQNPYGNNESGWNIYLTEWLNRFIDDLDFLSGNMIRRTRAAQTVTDWIDGYEIMLYNMEIRLAGDIAMPYYDIAIIREKGEYVKFYLVVMKSTERDLDRFDSIVKSFRKITAQGTPQSPETSFECEVPDYWSDETKAYYNKLMTQTTTDWGFFCASMPNDDSSFYSSALSKIISEQARLEADFDYDFDIIPTYTHLAYTDTIHHFPNKMAAETAGGNGFNGKPVLQFTYQFTTLNNTSLNGYTPMFDILRGKYDDRFRELARDIKAYKKPVLFRLNNEMNSDWTSYCGIVTLLDPDIFIMTWERLYNIFLEEGVDNCIWIWNPIAVSCPYSNWGEALNYLPGLDCVQALGLTHYEMNNGTSVTSFSSLYTALYNKNMPWFDNYPWIIGEFACGAGGEKQYNWDTSSYVDTVLGRNRTLQAQWVKEMFNALNNKENNAFASHIKAAVWFSVNDYVTIQGKSYITNKLSVTDDLTQTIAAFKEGFAASKEE